MSRVKLSKVLPKQLPEFVREDYPLFIKFLEYYYQYLDEQEVDVKTVRDLDETADNFVQHIKNEINFIGSFTESNPTLNEKTLLTHIGSSYRAKGSDESVKTLMRSIFNKDVEVMYPGEYMLRASDGKWQQDTALFVNITAGDPNTLVGDEISVSGEGKNVKVIVQRAEVYSGQIYELFIDKNFVGDIKAGYTISFEGVTGYVVNTTSASSIIRSGAGFRLGQIYEVRSNTGIGTRIKVTGVDASGGITKYVIINFGTGYLDDFYATITPPVYDSYTTQSSSPLTITKTSAGETTVQNSVSGSETEGFTDYGTIINPNYWAPEYSNGTYVGTKLRGFFNEQLKSLSNDYAVIEFRLGAVARYPGSYVKNDGFLSDASRIQDSRYYQAYSYVIRIDELLDTFKDAVKTYVHPAGMALFSDFEVKNYITLNATVQAVINFLRRKFEDDFTAYDEIAFKDIHKYLTEQSVVTEQRIFVVTKPLPEETVTPDDSVAKEFGKNVSDDFTATEAISQIILNKLINETAIASETYSLVFTKDAFTDSVVITDEFDIQQDHVASFTESSVAVDSGGFYVVNPYNYDQLYFAEHYANTRTTF